MAGQGPFWFRLVRLVTRGKNVLDISLYLWYVMIAWKNRQSKGGSYMAVKLKQIELELPQDIIFAMRGIKEIDDIKKKLKIALAIILFQERAISLGKATELAEMSRVKFIDLLKQYDLPAYIYTEEDFEKDRQALAKYRKMIKK
jgi:predicted HTH domain antitoxin